MKKQNRVIKIELVRVLFILSIFTMFSCIKSNHTSDQKKQQQIDLLISKAEDSMSNNTPFVRTQIQTAMSLVKDSLQYYEVLNVKACNYLRADSYDSAYTSLKRIIIYCQRLPSSPRINTLLSSVHNSMGGYFARIGNMDSAIFYYKIGYNQARLGTKSKTVLDICVNLADSYQIKSDFIHAAMYFRKALFLSDSLQMMDRMGFSIYFGLGQVYMDLRDFDQSDLYFNLAEVVLEERDLNEKLVYCNNRGNYYYYKEEYQKAINWFVRAKNLAVTKKYKFATNLAELNLSDVYLHLNKLDSAQYYSNKCYQFFSLINQRTALYYLTTIKAGIALNQNNSRLAHSLLENNKDTIGIEKKIISIRNKFLQSYYVKIGDFRQAYQYLLKNTQLDNSIQSERVKGRVAELDMRYKQDTSFLKRDLLIQNQQNSMETLRLSRYLLLLISLFILIVAIFVFIYMKKQRKLEFQQHLNKILMLRLENARGRVSPHFLFNSLNTIQDELNDKPDASKRLHAIVNMLRCSLLNIEKAAIPLKEEIEFVDNYLLLQKEKFMEDLKTEINIENTDIFDYKIPAMIIQIPVENAIKHGLSGKQTGEKILKVEAHQENGTLKISIADNGNGRKMSGASKIKGTGTGLKVISETLHLLNIRNEKKIQFSLIDLKNEFGENCGTKVEISIPLIFNFEL